MEQGNNFKTKLRAVSLSETYNQLAEHFTWLAASTKVLKLYLRFELPNMLHRLQFQTWLGYSHCIVICSLKFLPKIVIKKHDWFQYILIKIVCPLYWNTFSWCFTGVHDTDR